MLFWKQNWKYLQKTKLFVASRFFSVMKWYFYHTWSDNPSKIRIRRLLQVSYWLFQHQLSISDGKYHYYLNSIWLHLAVQSVSCDNVPVFDWLQKKWIRCDWKKLIYLKCLDSYFKNVYDKVRNSKWIYKKHSSIKLHMDKLHNDFDV